MGAVGPVGADAPPMKPNPNPTITTARTTTTAAAPTRISQRRALADRRRSGTRLGLFVRSAMTCPPLAHGQCSQLNSVYPARRPIAGFSSETAVAPDQDVLNGATRQLARPCSRITVLSEPAHFPIPPGEARLLVERFGCQVDAARPGDDAGFAVRGGLGEEDGVAERFQDPAQWLATGPMNSRSGPGPRPPATAYAEGGTA